jgi:hypothetical protein
MKRFAQVLIAALVLICGWGLAVAHEVRPGFLELRETGQNTYSFLWKKPTGGEVEIYIAPVIPDECRLTTAGRQQLTPGAVIVPPQRLQTGRPEALARGNP